MAAYGSRFKDDCLRLVVVGGSFSAIGVDLLGHDAEVTWVRSRTDRGHVTKAIGA